MLSLKGIMVRRSLAFCLTCLIISSGLWAAAADPKAIYDRSTDALYNLDFSIAQQGYETLTHDYPENPDYWNALGASIWLRIMYEQQKLNIESFTGPRLGTRESGDAVDAADERRLRETLDTAIAKADALLKKNPKDVRALYAKGISNATLASFEASAKRSYVSAGRKAKAARDLHKMVLEIDPAFDDARMSVGAFNYVVGVVPGIVRPILVFLGIRGEGKDAGIQQLEIAAVRGKNTATDARMLLMVVYNREKRYEDALNTVEQLHARYPRNFVFELSKASTYGKMKRWDDAVRTYEHILGKVNSSSDGYERLAAHKVYYSIGTSNVERHQFQQALTAFSHVTQSKMASDNEKANAHLWMGKIFDTGGQRAEALRQYDAILALNCDSETKSQARDYKRRAFK